MAAGVTRGRWPIVAAVILAALGAALALNTRAVNMATRPAAPRDGGRLVDTAVVRANVRVQGDGPAVVLIHGLGAALDWWDDIVPSLAKRHRVIRLDLIGHGGTAAPRSGYQITRQAALVAAVLDTLGVGRVSVIAHSMGGEVATAFVETWPWRIDSVVLIDTPPSDDAAFDGLTRVYLMPVIGQVLSRLRTDTALRRGVAQGFAPGFAVPERFIDDARQVTYPAFRSAHAASVAYRGRLRISDRLAKVRPVPPLLVIFGALDAIVPAGSAALYKSVPRADVVVLDGIGHTPMVETPSKTLDLIERILPDR